VTLGNSQHHIGKSSPIGRGDSPRVGWFIAAPYSQCGFFCRRILRRAAASEYLDWACTPKSVICVRCLNITALSMRSRLSMITNLGGRGDLHSSIWGTMRMQLRWVVSILLLLQFLLNVNFWCSQNVAFFITCDQFYCSLLCIFVLHPQHPSFSWKPNILVRVSSALGTCTVSSVSLVKRG